MGKGRWRRRGQGAAARVWGAAWGLGFDLVSLEGGCWGIYIGEGRGFLGVGDKK